MRIDHLETDWGDSVCCCVSNIALRVQGLIENGWIVVWICVSVGNCVSCCLVIQNCLM